MPEFLKLLAPVEARALLLDSMTRQLVREEEIETVTALHRVVTRDILAPHGLPEFARSTVDGYAIIAGDAYGASGTQPAYFDLAGEVPMGVAPSLGITSGKCALIHTGGMLPTGADAVVMLENTQRIARNAAAAQIEVLRSVAPGENAIKPGEDVASGQVVLEAGREIRAQEIGGLMALGLMSIHVRSRPRVAIISTGDEIVEPDRVPRLGQVRDVNARCLAALVADNGGEAILHGIVPDEPGRIQAVAREALEESDVLVITAGSSASTRDLTADTIRGLGSPGVLVHGISVRPGKPTILGVCHGKPVIGLPGNPVSAFVVARLMVLPTLAHLLGRKAAGPSPVINARLAVNLASQSGREDWWPTKLEPDPNDPHEWIAIPVFGRSNLIFNLVSADGLIRVPTDANGLAAGEPVQVEPL